MNTYRTEYRAKKQQYQFWTIKRWRVRMEKRKRCNQLILRLSDDEKYVLDAKCKNAEYKNKNDYLRHLILYGYTYFVDYSEQHDYNVNQVWRTHESILSKQPYRKH